ncbi:DUF2863 family protein [Usitatibacter palustris]|uniref:DUF2863 domain-containing protein n=1 Tax=Usitatibacter palustris TaxID=2732487 RepID=A0A6M4H835_9PROT|nr:DUF2863 family protein [Usitatibacter palustris]QJR15839.1 hypothetical protein DSM104440_02665 [Usitatibacter palustris]
MPRSRSKSPPRFTRDAERLIALSLGLNASGSGAEDRFWEAETSALVAKLLTNGIDGPIDSALDHLYQSNLGAYDTLIELIEAESESLVVMQGDAAWQALLIAVPIVAWSKYSIPSGPIGREDIDALSAQLQGHVLAADAKLVVVPYLQSIDQLPRQFSELRKLAARLGDCAVTGELPRIDFSRLPETAHLLADTRFVLACAAVPRGKPMFRWQEDASGHAGRAHSLEQWIAQARPTLAKLLPGCVFECLLPDAYYVNCRESDRRVRPFGVRAAVSFLEGALMTKAADIRAVVAGFGDDRIDEYRIAFTLPGDNDVAHGVVWPLYGREDENARPGPHDEVLAQLAECGIVDVRKLAGTFSPEFCEDCGAPLFANPEGEIVHAELPEEAESHTAHFH